MVNTHYQDVDVKGVINALMSGPDLINSIFGKLIEGLKGESDISKALLDLVFPAGAGHWEQHSGEKTPNELFPWTQWAIDTDMQGRVPVGSGGSYTLGAKGGSADAVVVKHYHYNEAALTGGGESYGRMRTAIAQYSTVPDGYKDNSVINIFEEGVDGTGRNMMPYTVVARWKRIA